MKHYYNELDHHAADWLRNLIADGELPAGDVDERSILDVRADDLKGYTQCHFFAGIGGWSQALKIAGVPASVRLFTGSCPCQPFSDAGEGKGFADGRHLWPAFFSLIKICRPERLLGEQVASKLGLGWLDLVQDDLEREGYAVGATILSAAAVGAPHIRRRLWFVAHASGAERRPDVEGRNDDQRQAERRQQSPADAGERDAVGVLAHADQPGRGEQRSGGLLDGEWPPQRDDADGRSALGVADAWLGEPAGCGRTRLGDQPTHEFPRQAGPWSDCDWLPCTDGKIRPVEPGTFPLVDGLRFKLGSGSPFEGKSRPKMLRGYGNAINPYVAAEFIKAAI